MRQSFPAVFVAVALGTAVCFGISSIALAANGKGRPSGAAAEAKAPRAPAAAPATPPTPESLQGDLDRIFAEAAMPKTTVAVRILLPGDPAAQPPAAPEVLYAVRADQPMVPASTMKLVTTAACFDRFGPEWRIKTYVGRVPSTGTDAKYDLAIIGGGDPNFSGRFWGGDSVAAFRKWAEALKARGLTAVGRVVLDDSLFDGVLQHPHWPANQRADWYEAPVSALTVNDSCIDIHVSPGRPGQPAVLRLDPPGGYAVVEGGILTTAEKKEHGFAIVRLDDAAGPMRLRASGRYWLGSGEASENRTVLDPTRFFGSALAAALQAEGIAVAGPVVRERLVARDGNPRSDFTCDLVHASRLDATIAVADKRSQGLYAECLMKMLGAFGPYLRPPAKPGEPATISCDTLLPPRQGSWATGTQEVRRWLAERGIPAEGCVFDDGSGLSKENRLTALAVTELLRVMLERYGDSFVATLAQPGQEGSLSKRMRGTTAEGRVWAKTGYVSGVSALSGYVRARSGRLIIFSVIMNDMPLGDLWKARQAQDKVCMRLVEY